MTKTGFQWEGSETGWAQEVCGQEYWEAIALKHTSPDSDDSWDESLMEDAK